MSDPTLLITISRSGDDLVLSGSEDANNFGVTNFVPPAEIPRYVWMDDADDIDGSELASVSLEHGVLSFDWAADRVTTETAAKAAKAEVLAAIRQFEFTVTTQENDATPEVWYANRGGMRLANQGRTYMDMVSKHPVYTVEIPVYPTPGGP